MALVLAGGSGERLGVLCSERAVSALPFGGKYRVVDFVLSNCCHSGLDQVGILTQHAPTSLHDHIGAGRPWDLDRRGRGVLILQPYMTRRSAGWYRGTADAIAQNWDVIEDRASDQVVILPGDHVYRMDYRPLLQTHRERGAAATIAVARVASDQARRFGMVTLDREGRVLALEEKPERASTPFASMGIALFETEVLADRLRGRPVDLTLDVLKPMIDSGEHVAAELFSGYWEDVGTVGSYYRANLETIAPDSPLALEDQRWPILTRDEERPPVLVRDGACVEDALVANGCRVAGTVRHSVLFPGVTVEAGAQVVGSIVMQDVRLGAGSRIERAILDKFVRIGEGARVGGPSAGAGNAPEWLEGLTLVGKDAVLPAGVRVEPPSVIGAGATPEDFATAAVGPGTLMPNRTWYEEGP